jgi:shikimate kinase
MVNRIYILGFMGVGKSTTAKALARKLGYDFVDTDKLLEKKFKININNFFSKYGEELFRELEHEILLETFIYNKCVIATGGGLPCYFDAMDKINANGVSIFLKMDEKSIVNRLMASKQKRPLLSDLSDEELLNFVERKLNSRINYYSKAWLTIPALDMNIDHLVAKISEHNTY